MSLTITHTKTNTIPDWDQQKLDAAISAGLYPQGTRLADIVLPSDWNASHTVGELSITSCTFANLPSPASSYTGQQRIVTDCNNSIWISNGTAWKPVGGRFLYAKTQLPVVRAPTFTGTTNGAITLGTSTNAIYAKCYMYFAANTLVASHAAGFFYVEMSSTTAGIAYNNTYTPAAGTFPTAPSSKTSFSGAVPGGAGVTSQITAFITTVKGNVLGASGAVLSSIAYELNSSAGNKTLGIYNGATTLGADGGTNNSGGFGTHIIQNIATNIQRCTNRILNTSNTNQALLGAIDTTADFDIKYTLIGTTATDWQCLSNLSIYIEVP